MLPFPLNLISTRGWLLLGSIAVVVFLVVAAVTSCQDQRSKVLQDRVTNAVAEGRTISGQEAVAKAGDVSKRASETDDLTRMNQDAILSAPGAQESVDPALDAAGRCAICMRASARNSPSCQRLLKSCPR